MTTERETLDRSKKSDVANERRIYATKLSELKRTQTEALNRIEKKKNILL